jgi:chemotaxis protein CheD
MITLSTDPHPPEAVYLAAGIGQCVISRDLTAVLAAYGLGSCIAIAAWDSAARVAGMIHILLPESPAGKPPASPARFAATGVPLLLREVEAAGGMRSRLRVVAAGGAQMLSALAVSGALKGIGERNAAVVTERLRAEGITLVASDFGGTAGRTLTLSVATGKVHVRAINGTPREL